MPAWNAGDYLHDDVESQACVSEDDFVSVSQCHAFTRTRRNWNQGAIPGNGGSMGAAIVVETERRILEIEFNVSMSARDGLVGSGCVISKCHVVLSCEPLFGVDNFREASQVDASLLEKELVLLGRTGDDREPDLSRLLQILLERSASVMHIETPSGNIRR